MRRAVGSFAVATVLVLAVGVALNPQIVVLAGEGFPDAEWPAAGAFVTVRGDDRALPNASAPLPAGALARFDESGGKALIVVRNGTLITERYARGYGRERRLNSYSLVKTLVGALTLRAVADGRLALDTTLAEALGTDAPSAVTVRDVLAMRAGLTLPPEPAKAASGVADKALDDAAFSPFSAIARLHAFGPDVLNDRLALRPEGLGEFEYQSAYTALLGAMVERAYDRPLQDVLSELIWRLAGAGDAQWRRYPRDERATAYCCLYARPGDWARIGAFLLANGTADTPFLPEALWREFVLPDLREAQRAGAYGWHVRHDVLDREGAALAGPFAYAMGHNGQMLYLLPAENAAVVRFGAEPQLLHSTLYELAPLIAGD